MLIGIDDKDKEHIIGKANWSNFSVGENGVLVHNAFDGIDLEMKASLGSVKTNFIIKEYKFSTYKQLVFRDEFKSNEACVLNFKKGQSGSVYVSIRVINHFILVKVMPILKNIPISIPS